MAPADAHGFRGFGITLPHRLQYMARRVAGRRSGGTIGYRDQVLQPHDQRFRINPRESRRVAFEARKPRSVTPRRSARSLTPPPFPCTLAPVPANKSQLPHPADLAARQALAKEPPIPLSRVLEQAAASEQWRKHHASGAGGNPKASNNAPYHAASH